MTAPSGIDPARFLHEQLAPAGPDPLRQLPTTFLNTLLSAEPTRSAAPATASAARPARTAATATGPGCSTPAGTLQLAVPRLRSGSHVPDWLLERRRAERALIAVVATCSLLGVSTRRRERLVESLGITRLWRSAGSEVAKDLDAQGAEVRHRPLDAGPYTFLAADA